MHADEQIVRWQVGVMSTDETDARVRVWMRVQFGGECAADLVRELGCSDGSGILRVIQRLERQAGEDASLAGKLKAARRQLAMSGIRSYPQLPPWGPIMLPQHRAFKHCLRRNRLRRGVHG